MTVPCGCCDGVERLTPDQTANRPGLPALSYRVRTHATFLETMLARLSSSDHPALARLRTRDRGDASIALLDCWATIADVLTFYQERLANEGYLRTATERRSVLELAQLIGYQLRPGVSASVYLAYDIDNNQKDPVVIPAGAKVQSVPGPGELPQTFETSEKFEARAEWNNLQVRKTRPQYIENVGSVSDIKDKWYVRSLYLKGAATNLKPNDVLYFDFGGEGDPKGIRLIDTVATDFQNDRTSVQLQVESNHVNRASDGKAGDTRSFNNLVVPLTKDLFIPPRSSRALDRSMTASFKPASDIGVHLVTELLPKLQSTLYSAWSNAKATQDPSLKAVHAFHVNASLFGHNAPKQLSPDPRDSEGPVLFRIDAEPTFKRMWREFIFENSDAESPKGVKTLALDTTYDQIKPGSWVYIIRPDTAGDIEKNAKRVRSVHKVVRVETQTLEAGTFSSKVTILTLDSPWLTEVDVGQIIHQEGGNSDMPGHALFLPRVTVYTQSEPFVLAEEPIHDCVGLDEKNKNKGNTIELSGLVEGLVSGRWLIVSGEREDIKGQAGETIRGVMASELVMLAGIVQTTLSDPVVSEGRDIPKASDNQDDKGRPGDRIHTFLQLADKGLTYCYKRDTVKIYGNVIKATHGETRNEVLGSGDAAKSFQAFAMKQPPLTYVSAPTKDGVQSTLVVRVNDVKWGEAETLAGLGPVDQRSITKTDDESKTSVIFGNGEHGMRLPTGVENVRASYRNGIGKAGNVKADQLTLLGTRPLGVRGVTNPIRASGGADRDTRDQAKRNAPLAVLALDRLVATSDYADFARTFAGIGKAHAQRLSDSRQPGVHVTIAGVDDIPIGKDSDLFRNLTVALREFGDPFLPITVDVRSLKALLISAEVVIHSDYDWEIVEPQIRAKLLDEFGFDRRELGQPVFASQVINAIQSIRGVTYTDLDVLAGITESDLLDPEALKKKLDELAAQQTNRAAEHVEASLAKPNSVRTIQPAELVILTPAVPDTLILKLRTSMP